MLFGEKLKDKLDSDIIDTLRTNFIKLLNISCIDGYEITSKIDMKGFAAYYSLKKDVLYIQENQVHKFRELLNQYF